MKKLITVMLGITCVAAFSFFKNAQKLGFTKLGANLYVAKTAVPMSDVNKKNLQAGRFASRREIYRPGQVWRLD